MSKEIDQYYNADRLAEKKERQKRYRILVSTETRELESQATDLIERGWNPLGAVTVQQRTDGAFVYLQTMVLSPRVTERW